MTPCFCCCFAQDSPAAHTTPQHPLYSLRNPLLLFFVPEPHPGLACSSPTTLHPTKTLAGMAAAPCCVPPSCQGSLTAAGTGVALLVPWGLGVAPTPATHFLVPPAKPQLWFVGAQSVIGLATRVTTATVSTPEQLLSFICLICCSSSKSWSAASNVITSQTRFLPDQTLLKVATDKILKTGSDRAVAAVKIACAAVAGQISRKEDTWKLSIFTAMSRFAVACCAVLLAAAAAQAGRVAPAGTARTRLSGDPQPHWPVAFRCVY